MYDICKTVPCDNKGICTPDNSAKGYECKCRLIGDPNNDCKLNEKDDCADNPPIKFQNFITCIDLIGKFSVYSKWY